MRSATLVVVILSVAVSACGGSEESPESRPATTPRSDEAKIAETVIAYNTAVADGDYERACELVNSEGAAAISNFVSADKAFTAGATACPQALKEMPTLVGGKKVFEDFKFAEVTDVQIRGETARAELDVRGAAVPQVAELDRYGDEWKISRPPGI